MIIGLAVGLVVSGGAPGAAREFFLSPDGDDESRGTAEQPWRSLAKANAMLEPGDTVILRAGEYEGVFEPANSGREGAPITYSGPRGGGAILRGGKSSDDQWTCIRLKQREHIVIRRFSLEPTRGGWMRLDAASHCIIHDCAMVAAKGTYNPIECRDCHYNRYRDLTCWRSINLGEYGHLHGDMWNNFNCSHNVFERVHISRAGHRPFGLWFDCPYNVVRDCIFDCRWGRNFEFFSTPRLLVEGCVITNGFDGSGSADGRAKLFIIDSIFRHNVIYRNHYGPMVINSYKWQDEDAWGMMRSRIYHNTWYRNHEYGYEMIDLGEKPDPHMVTGNIFQNNIFAFNDPGGDGLALLLYSNIAEDNVFRHNLFFGSKPGDKTIRYDWTFPGVSEWSGLMMTATEANEQKPEQFVGNIEVDPLFRDAEADDLRLENGSPAIDAGRPLAVAREAGSGTDLPVDDARWFYDGFGVPGEYGDIVCVGPKERQARVLRADIDANVLTLDRDLSWREGDTVSLPFPGSAPDMGAYEFGGKRGTYGREPAVPEDLRLETMETATEPVVVTDFEPDNLEEWFYYWNFSRQRNTTARLDNTTAASGKHSMRVFAEKDGANLSCDIRPRWWDIDRFPFVRLSYRIPPGVPLGLWLHAFKSSSVGRGAVCVGGTSAREVGGYRDLARHELIDDDAWHEVTLDARVIREVFPEVKLLQMFRFYTNGNGTEGQQYWFDNFRIVPTQNGGRG
jgi:hypothetical protein